MPLLNSATISLDSFLALCKSSLVLLGCCLLASFFLFLSFFTVDYRKPLCLLSALALSLLLALQLGSLALSLSSFYLSDHSYLRFVFCSLIL